MLDIAIGKEKRRPRQGMGLVEYRRIIRITEGLRFLAVNVLDANGITHSYHWSNEYAPDARDWVAVVEWLRTLDDVDEPLLRLLEDVDEFDVARWQCLSGLPICPIEWYVDDLTNDERRRLADVLKEMTW